MKKETGLFKRLIIDPAIKNVASVFFWGGVFLVFVGAAFGDGIDDISFVPSGAGEALLRVGSAVLGAGVFAIIMKSAQFSEVFQKHIFDVFFHPENAVSGVQLKEKWKDITNALLKEVLPKSHLDASDEIFQQFLSSELGYHFEEYYISYTITVDKETNIASIETFSKSSVILSPHSPNPVFVQSVVSDRGAELKALRFDGADALADNQFVKDKENGRKDVLEIPLNNYAKARSDGDKVVRLEKVTKWTQDLSVDPYIMSNITRYIKGATIRAKASSDYKVFFERYGLGGLPENNHLVDDGEGYERWELVKPSGLLLPGQGYVLVIVPKLESSVE